MIRSPHIISNMNGQQLLLLVLFVTIKITDQEHDSREIYHKNRCTHQEHIPLLSRLLRARKKVHSTRTRDRYWSASPDRQQRTGGRCLCPSVAQTAPPPPPFRPRESHAVAPGARGLITAPRSGSALSHYPISCAADRPVPAAPSRHTGFSSGMVKASSHAAEQSVELHLCVPCAIRSPEPG